MAADLNTVWEWNVITGDPFYPPEDSPNTRYYPTIAEMEEFLAGQHRTANHLKEGLITFITSNQTELTSRFEVTRTTSSKLAGYLRVLRALRFKKIHVDYVVGGTLRLNKLPRDTPFNGEPDGDVNHQFTYHDLDLII